MVHLPYIILFFALGACIGSFLNVVVWRLPREESLVTPPSHCPKCDTQLTWYDNIPILGWIALRGKCRYCKAPISARYPIVEAVTACLFAGYYAAFFLLQIGACPPVAVQMVDSVVPAPAFESARDWPIYLLYMFLISSLLAASLIDAELYIIPLQIPWLLAGVGLLFHALIDRPTLPGAVNLVSSSGEPTMANAIAAGGGVGLLISMVLWWLGRMPTSFPQGEPILEVDRAAMAKELEQAKRDGRDPGPLPPPYTPRQIRAEMLKEMAFLLPPVMLAAVWLLLTLKVGPVRQMWTAATAHQWVTALLGSIFGALIGGAIVWIIRILGTLGFGRVAMGLGDVHLMLGVGAIVGAGPVTVAFFLAPFCGLLVAVYLLLTGTRREIPYGPYLSLGTGMVLLWYCPIIDWLFRR